MIDKNIVKHIAIEPSKQMDEETLKVKAFSLFEEGYKNIQVAATLLITCSEAEMLRLSYERRKSCQ